MPLLGNQMVQFDLTKEASTVLKNGRHSEQRFKFDKQKVQVAKNTEGKTSVIGLLSTLFSS